MESDLGTAVLLGVLQGLTEFLPVSSSGHVALGAHLFGIPDLPLSMVVILHAGTLVATLFVVGEDVLTLAGASLSGLTAPKAFFASEAGRTVVAVVLATLPTAIAGLLLEARVRSWNGMPWVIGMCFLGSALAVLSTRRGGGPLHVPTLKASLLIGLAQGLAVMPGLSRSGMTIAAGMALGLTARDAFRFSFILSLPAIVGALVLELGHPGAPGALGWAAAAGGAAALVVGYGALRGLRHIVVRGRLWAFALYLIPLSAAVILWDTVFR